MQDKIKTSILPVSHGQTDIEKNKNHDTTPRSIMDGCHAMLTTRQADPITATKIRCTECLNTIY